MLFSINKTIFESLSYLPKLTEKQYKQYNSKVEFIEESGYYHGFIIKAFNIWYSITKLHLLTDGNKRAGLVYFLLYCKYSNQQPELSLDNDSFVELALNIASSDSNNKEQVLEQLKKRVKFSRVNLLSITTKTLLESYKSTFKTLSET